MSDADADAEDGPIYPCRSVLYVPCANPRALAKARDLPADAVVLDLEDSAALDAKDAARDAAMVALSAGGWRAGLVMVRVNGVETPWGAADLAACARHLPQAVLLPKVDGPEDVAEAARVLPDGVAIWAMIETARGVLNAADIADAPRTAGLVIGTNDLARTLRCRVRPDRLPLIAALQAAILAARAAGIPCIDGVHVAIRDPEGLEAECVQGRDLGMDGKTLIHPAQIAVANAVFAPDPEAVRQARATIEAFDAARACGEGVAVLDGRLVEALHVEIARRTLALCAAIAAREGMS